MDIAKTIEEVRKMRYSTPGKIALVPTMGALHEGHLSLVEEGYKHADHVIVYIFVNPTQFAPHEDFDAYPRSIDDDLAKLKKVGVKHIFLPNIDEIYPADGIPCEVDVANLNGILEGEFRPHFFGGVCRVLTKMFNIVQPHFAVMGQKDYQQLQIVTAMVEDMCMPMRVIAAPTKREDDGLAMSSRNVYLNDKERRQSTGIFKALQQAKHMIEVGGETDPEVVESAMNDIISTHHFDSIDYATIRHPRTLQPIDCIEPKLSGGVVGLIAAHMGKTRLIDNMIFGSNQ
ncbi:Pantoate-beta-alanine ligase [Poriferisphaera corsica]|uniref:Pantothenate synthetase n=1 Tax=Poriferisphaera corsica TaxID=2528020 RepID=A0A517YPK9_9BACT|nr:pantoate--beta-alanine ligase [Poriferisphaera corsica]QDU32156.1 Pantoate-beta-alanine ligase [Poriferisphaera corsica]